MAHLFDKHLLQRANSVILLTFVGGGLAACAIAAAIFDISHWLVR